MGPLHNLNTGIPYSPVTIERILNLPINGKETSGISAAQEKSSKAERSMCKVNETMISKTVYKGFIQQ